MNTIDRLLQIDLPPGQSAFLWGPRKAGKSTLLRLLFPDSPVFDLLKTDLFLEFSRSPSILRERLFAMGERALAHPVILDEVQKVPQLLDEVHHLIEDQGMRFILCGSSARKLKRGKANLLGGRAWRLALHPLSSAELGEFDLLTVLNRGLLPSHYLSSKYRRSLKAYCQDYLKEEVFEEGLTRNVPAFSRFFEAMAHSHGELTNYSNIARDCGVDSKTVREYYQILIDTLLGYRVDPWKRRQDRQTITRASKFYLFDVGVAGALAGRRLDAPGGELFGKAFEHFILMELVAHSSYSELDYPIRFWRTKSGLEVDFILGEGDVAVEVKGTSRVDSTSLRGLRRFVSDYRPRYACVVCNEAEERVVGDLHIVPYEIFLRRLWAGDLVS